MIKVVSWDSSKVTAARASFKKFVIKFKEQEIIYCTGDCKVWQKVIIKSGMYYKY